MTGAVPVANEADLPARYRGTPVAHLVLAHNLGAPIPEGAGPIVLATCIDARITWSIPPGFAYVLRTAGVSLRQAEWDIAFAVGAGGARAIAVVAHNDCRAGSPDGYRERFLEGLVEAGWEFAEAKEMWETQVDARRMGDPVEFAEAEAARVKQRYPNLPVLPLVYDVGDRTLWALP